MPDYDCASVLGIEPTAAEREEFAALASAKEWMSIVSIGDLDDYEDALRLFCRFARRVEARGRTEAGQGDLFGKE